MYCNDKSGVQGTQYMFRDFLFKGLHIDFIAHSFMSREWYVTVGWECIYQNFVVMSISPYLFVTIASLDPELSMNAWLSKLESSSWLDYVQSVLSTACFVAQCLDTQGSVKLLRLPTFTSLICVETADFMYFILVSSELYMIKHHTKALFVNSIDWSSIQSSIQHSYFIPLILVRS